MTFPKSNSTRYHHIYLAIVTFVLLHSKVIPANIRHLKKLKVKFVNDTNYDLKKTVGFYLYTRENVEEPQRVWIEDRDSVLKSNYNFSKKTNFMTHGWLNTHEGLNCKTVKKAFLENDDCNVIVIDWGEIAKLDYKEASSRVKMVGGYVAKMIDFLESLGTNVTDVTMCGHSLGAQMIGLAGYQTKNKVGRVVGLDPAGLLFELGGPGECISIEDGQIVEIIHTAIGDTILTRPAGHFDFYPNGGSGQPGCPGDNQFNCEHDRAYELFAESLVSENLVGRKCDSYNNFLMGLCDDNPVLHISDKNEVSEVLKGSYYLITGSTSPYGLGLAGSKAPCTELNKCS